MIQLKEKQKRSEQQFSGFMPLAATAVIAIVVSLGLAWILFRSDGQTTQAEPVEIVTATPIPINIVPIEPSMIPTVQPFEFEQSATAVLFATETPMPTPTIDPFALTATQLFTEATRMAAPPTRDATLQCQFEGELILRINQSQIAPNDTLVIRGAALNTRADKAYLEIFGGFLTDDIFQPINQINNPSPVEAVLATINGEAYPNGSYLVQIRLTDLSGETLSSCALPVTFSD